MHNPTVARFEDAIAALESADGAVAFASGMAAITATLLAARTKDKQHIVAVRPLYGATDTMLSSGLLGLSVSYASEDTVKDMVRPDTALVICESPANPSCTIVDIESIVKQAGDVPVMVDSTFATPVLQRPSTNGATIVLHSCTKAIGGHGDVLGGVVASNAEWAQRIRKVRSSTGANIHPFAAFMLHRGLQTLPVRVRAMQATAEEIACRLEAHPLVSSVSYPSLAKAKGASAGLIGAGKQMEGGGTVLAFELKEGYEAACAVMSSVKLVVPAVSLGTTDTLIQHPAGVTHTSLGDDAKKEGGISPGLMRLSIGLEQVDDIWDDLKQAIESLTTAKA